MSVIRTAQDERSEVNELRSRLRSLLSNFPEVSLLTVADATCGVLDEIAKSRGSHNPTARAILRGHAAKEELKSLEGGHVSADVARVFLNLSKPSLIERFNKGKLLGWREKNAIRFPVWQFAAEGGLLPGLEEILAALSTRGSYDDWAKILFFLNSRHSLKGKRPLDMLREGKIQAVLDLARIDD